MKGVSCQCVYFCVRDVPPPPFPPHPISFLSGPYKGPRNPCSVADFNRVSTLNIQDDRDYSVSLVSGASSLQDRGACCQR